MSRILLTWEVGAGLGHLTKLEPIARGLLERGHTVLLAAKNVVDAETVFCDLPIPILQSPILLVRLPRQLPRMDTFPEGLFNSGFGSERHLLALAQSWRDLLDLVRPDYLVADHSPAALLAARGLAIPRTIVGHGVYCPPDESPLPALTVDGQEPASEKQRSIEEAVLENANSINGRLGWHRLDRISQLYNDVDEVCLATFEELDHYHHRQGAIYGGVWSRGQGQSVQWPAGNRPRAFCYLRSTPTLKPILRALSLRGVATALYVPYLEEELATKLRKIPRLEVAEGPMDLASLDAADLCINNGTGAMVAQSLLASKPQFMAPVAAQHVATAYRVETLGAGISLRDQEVDQIAKSIGRVLKEPSFGSAARRFAEKYGDFDEAESARQIVHRLCQRLETRQDIQER